MAIDRAAALRQAEKLLREGKLESAIAEYMRVVDDQPRDWTTANTLGDLYLRAQLPEKAIEQFVRVADNLSREGFLPKAAAVYKKILKIRPDDDHALLQTGEIAAKQGVLVDARTCWKTVAAHRLARGDRRGAAEVRVRLGLLDPADLEARRESARARIELDDMAGALRELQAIADDFREKGCHREAIDVLAEAARLSPSDEKIQGQLFTIQMSLGDLAAARVHARTPEHNRALGQAHLAAGRMDEAAQFLTSGGGRDPQLVLKIADAKFRSKSPEAGLAILRDLLHHDPPSATDITRFGWELARSSPDTGFRVMELTTEVAVREGDWPLAAAGLQEFIRQNPNYIPALMRLVEICVDGGLEATLYGAQGQLADAYLAAGAAAEARVILEDLVAREPDERTYVDRLHRAIAMLGPEKRETPPVDPVVKPAEPAPVVPAVSEARPAATEAPVPDAVPQTLDEPGLDSMPALEMLTLETEESETTRLVREIASRDLDADDFAHLELRTSSLDLDGLLEDGYDVSSSPVAESTEIDLSLLLDDVASDDPATVDPLDAGASFGETRNFGELFEQFRPVESSAAGSTAGEQEYERGVALREAGRIDESLQAFQTASRAPRQRFRAATALGRMYRDLGTLTQAIEWFERAAESPAPSLEEVHALFYELAETLEAVGETSRALAVYLELQADAGEYRDVSVKINRLSRAQARG